MSTSYPAPGSAPASSKTGTAFFFGCFGAVLGVGLLVIIGTAALIAFTVELLEDEVKTHIAKNEIVTQKLGTINAVSIAWVASTNISDEDTFVYDVDGSIADGKVEVYSTTNDDGDEVFHKVTLYLGSETIVIEDHTQ